jgi:hypothetical protein
MGNNSITNLEDLNPYQSDSQGLKNEGDEKNEDVEVIGDEMLIDKNEVKRVKRLNERLKYWDSVEDLFEIPFESKKVVVILVSFSLIVIFFFFLIQF